jgi:3-hydroxyisobutyrate dehydrogenase
MTLKIAFLGLGIMGAGMVRRLIGAGFEVSVYNRNPERAAPFADQARVAASPREAAEDADVIIAMLTDDAASRGVWLGADGAITGMAADAVCIEASTLSPDWIAEWAQAVAVAGGVPLDAPVTGSKVAAETGELVFIIGGDAGGIARATPALKAMSKDIVHLGPSGSGTKFKLINNFVGGVQIAALAEGLAMIEQSGLAFEKSVETLISGAPGSPMVKMITARVLAGDYRPNFQVSLQAKDMAYAVTEAEKLGVDLRTVKAAIATFDAAVADGYGTEDIAAVIKSVRVRSQ